MKLIYKRLHVAQGKGKHCKSTGLRSNHMKSQYLIKIWEQEEGCI